ncbi:MAG TPA: Ig domain-containing protein, partial [Terriglobales bacterium]|nr:Ig domain-containing protein [Terriglobales bacterium]
MQWKTSPLLVLGLIACMVGAGCSSSSHPGGQVRILDSSLPAGTVGTAYSYSMSASGGTAPYVWSVTAGTLPAGLKLSSQGVISGTPTTAGTSSFTVKVMDSEPVPVGTTAAFSLTIKSTLTVTSQSLPAGTVGVSYSTTLAATGGVAPYTWSITGGNLPAGLSLSSAGVISGTPTASGTANFTVQVADSESPAQTAQAQLSITVNVITITTQTLPAGSINVPYAASLTAVGGVTPYSWTLTSGTLPAGLNLNSTGVISGTPTATGSSTFEVQVADSEQPPATASAQLTLTINSQGNPGALSGNYVFYLNGFNSSGAWTLAGSFISDGNGNITSGVVDGNSVVTPPYNVTVSGTYSIATSGLNTMTIQGTGWGPMTLAFVLDSAGNGRIIEYDDTTGQGSRGSGVLRKATSSAFLLSALNGSWVFGGSGSDHGTRDVQIGQFTLNSGNISNGTDEENDGGTYKTGTFTGTVSAVDPQTGRATAVVQSSTGTAHEVVYVVSSSEAVMEDIDSNGPPIQVGSMLQQSGTFNNSSLNGLVVDYYQETNTSSGDDESGAMAFSFDGQGNLSLIVGDNDDAGTISSVQPFQATYTVAANGAVTVTQQGGGTPPAIFLVAQNKGFGVGTGSNPELDIIEPQ